MATTSPKRQGLTAAGAAEPAGVGLPEHDRSVTRAAARQGWQAEAAAFYSGAAGGELRFGIDVRAQQVARGRLRVAQGPTSNPTFTREDHPAQVMLDAILDAAGGSAAVLERLSVLLDVVGDGFLVGHRPDLKPLTEDDTIADLEWVVCSGTDLRASGTGTFKVPDHRGQTVHINVDHAYTARVWDPDPFEVGKPTSAVRAVLPILRELQALTMHVGAQIDSRLAGAGIFVVPQEITFPSSPEDADDDTPAGVDRFMADLAEAMMTAIEDRDSAEALVPIVLQVPAEYAGTFERITFHDGGLDETALDLREEALRRLAIGLTLPPGVLMGLEQASQWTGWLVDESFLTQSVEPMLRLIAGSLSGALRPLLRTFGEDLVVVADTTALRSRISKSEAAAAAYDRHAISAAALRAASGWDDAAAPPPEETKLRLLIEFAKSYGVLGPVMEALGMPEADPGLPPTVSQRPGADPSTPPPDAERTQPSESTREAA